MSRSARRQEQQELAEQLRRSGATTSEIARALRDRYGLNGRLSARGASTAPRPTRAMPTARHWPGRWNTWTCTS